LLIAAHPPLAVAFVLLKPGAQAPAPATAAPSAAETAAGRHPVQVPART